MSYLTVKISRAVFSWWKHAGEEVRESKNQVCILSHFCFFQKSGEFGPQSTYLAASIPDIGETVTSVLSGS